MKKYLLTLSAACSLFAANDLTPPEGLQKARRPILAEEKKSSKLLFSGDFLYWVPEMEGLAYAKQSYPTESKQLNNKTKEIETTRSYSYRALEIEGSWEPGLRLSMGYLFDEKGWDASLIWTHFKNDTSSEAATKSEQKLSPTTPSTDGFYSNLVDTAKGKWNLNQNIADIEVGKNFPVGEEFLARPFFGLRGARIENHQTISYETQILDNHSLSHISTKSLFWGTGPRLGASAAYEMGKGIGIFALGSGALLAGTLDSSPKKSPGLQAVTSLQIEIGCQWKRTFQNKYHFGIQAAWEQNFFSGVSQPFEPIKKEEKQFAENNDLALKGLTASCHLNF